MSAPSPVLVRIGQPVAALSIVTAGAGVVLLAALGQWDFILGDFQVHHAVIAAGFGLVSWMALPGQAGNRAVWVLTLAAAFSALYVAGSAVALVAAGNPSRDALFELSPSELPVVARWALASLGWTTVPGLGLAITLGILLFPSGTYTTRMARAVGWTSTVALVVASMALAWSFRPSSTLPFGAEDVEYSGVELLLAPATLVLIGASLYAFGGLARRSASSRGEARQQYRWVLLGVGTLVVALTASVFTGPFFGDNLAGSVIELIGLVVAVAAYGIALVKHRLWDIDVVIHKTVVFFALTAFIGAIYSVIAVGIGRLIGGSGLWLSVLATAVAAVAFEPFRTKAQRWASRLVYGERATPYEVLSEITGRLATAEPEEGLLEHMASRLEAGTGAVRAAVWWKEGDGFSLAAASSLDGPLATADVTDLPGAVELIEHDGEVLGALTVEKAPGDALIPAERALMADLAGSAALVMRRLRLEAELRATARELDDSRRRVVTVQDVERRRLERELHDQVEQPVVALALALEDTGRLAREEGTSKAARLVDQLVRDTEEAVDRIRSLGRGLFPALLEADGLAAAVPALASLSPLDVRVDADVTRRHPLELEGAVYFCVSEALTNASKHARGPVSVTVSDAAGELSFDVTDSGPGFDPVRGAAGAGLRNMADRLDTLGGSVSIRSAPGASTTVSGALPVEATPAGGSADFAPRRDELVGREVGL